MAITWMLVLAFSLITALLLFGMITYGARNRDRIQVIQQDLDTSSTTLQGNVCDLMRVLEQSRAQQEQIVRRLENLEAIVTSEAWDALQAGEDAEQIKVLLEEGELEEPSAEEKARRIARRLHH